jgi:hypothetical protein
MAFPSSTPPTIENDNPCGNSQPVYIYISMVSEVLHGSHEPGARGRAGQTPDQWVPALGRPLRIEQVPMIAIDMFSRRLVGC